MDINGTRFHLLTGADDWEPRLAQSADVDLWWDREGAVLSLLPEVVSFGARAGEAPLTGAQRRGSDVDAFGNFYWIDAARGAIRILPAGGAEAGDYWRVADAQVCAPADGGFAPAAPSVAAAGVLSGLAVTREHYLVVGSLAPAGLYVFDLHGGGPPRWWPWPAGFAPLDLAAADDGGVWILDRVPAAATARLWRLDRLFRVQAWGPQPAAGAASTPDFTPEPPFSGLADAPVTSSSSITPVSVTLADTTAVNGLPDGSVLLLGRSGDGAHSVIQRLRNGVMVNEVALHGGILQRVLQEPRVVAHDFAFLATATDYADEVMGELSLVLDDGNQALTFGLEAFRDTFRLSIVPRYLPLRRFSGKALVAGAGAIYYDLDQRWYPLTPQPRPRYAQQARLEGLVFDGREEGCRWHRVFLDAMVPEGARVRLFSRAADERDHLAEMEWVEEPAPYLRGDGAEVVLHRPFSARERAFPGTGTWESLLQRATGRYLELALVLTGDGRSTPRIRALRVYYPRFSYLHRYLPAAYREDTHSANFLERYLANAEGILSVVEDRVARAESYFDSRTVPSEYLEWLADWVGAACDAEWEEGRKRLLIDNAELLFRWRGTAPGMRAAIRLATDPCVDAGLFDELRDPGAVEEGRFGGRRVRIVERFRYRELPGVVIGDPTEGAELPMAVVADPAAALGTPAALAARYREFLTRRYETVDALNTAWRTAYANFDAVTFSAEPATGPARKEWLQFLQREHLLTGTWSPAQGAYALHLRFQEYLRRRYVAGGGEAGRLAALNAAWGSACNSFDAILFSPVVPAVSAAAADWKAFVREGIGFTYAPVTEADTVPWREFLAREYRNVTALNAAHGSDWSGFAAVTLPGEQELPAGGRPLADWVRFVSLTLPLRRNAHRFTVLVPTDPGELPETRARRIGQVETVVRREKPAHTDYDVKLFWALFQAGTARLGEDTVLGESARYTAIVLDGTYLGRGLLAYGQPWNAASRSVVGRDRMD